MNEIALSKENPIIASVENMEAAVAQGLISELLSIVEAFDSEISNLWMKKGIISYDERIALGTFYIEECLKAILDGKYEHAEFLAKYAAKELIEIDVKEYVWAPYISENLKSRIEAFGEVSA